MCHVPATEGLGGVWACCSGTLVGRTDVIIMFMNGISMGTDLAHDGAMMVLKMMQAASIAG